MKALDLFAGPGGWSLACRQLGITDYGIEKDEAARATRDAAGFLTVHDDVTTFDIPTAITEGLIASPPCQTFSMAGKGAGRAALETVLLAIKHIAAGEWPTELLKSTGDPRTALVVEPLRYALAMNPEWIALEQVPTVLPVWVAIAEVLRSRGYFVWVGKVYAEQYGTPQTRTRAVLLASRTRPVGRPVPTHSRYYSRSPERLDPGALKWVSMAEALGWGLLQRPSYTVMGGGTDTGGAEPFANSARRAMSAAQDVSICMTNPRPNAAVRTADKPAPTVAFGHETPRWMVASGVTGMGTPRDIDHPAPTQTDPENATNRDWPCPRPAPTVVGSFAPDVIAAPGYRKAGDPPRQKTPGSVRVTVAEAAVLQDFPADFPFQGSKTKQFQQVGNAIPSRLAAACLTEVLGLGLTAAAE